MPALLVRDEGDNDDKVVGDDDDEGEISTSVDSSSSSAPASGEIVDVAAVVVAVAVALVAFAGSILIFFRVLYILGLSQLFTLALLIHSAWPRTAFEAGARVPIYSLAVFTSRSVFCLFVSYIRSRLCSTEL